MLKFILVSDSLLPIFLSEKAEKEWREAIQELKIGLRINTEKILKELKTK